MTLQEIQTLFNLSPTDDSGWEIAADYLDAQGEHRLAMVLRLGLDVSSMPDSGNEIGYGDGRVSGNGHWRGNGCGYGSGYGNGYEGGYGHGNGSGSGRGAGDGYGTGNGDGTWGDPNEP
jgi:hypothetical protein